MTKRITARDHLILLLALSLFASSAATADTPKLRYDGLYWTGFINTAGTRTSYAKYLKFRKDGNVMSVSSVGRPTQVEKWIDKNRHVSRGRYKIEDGKIRFTVSSRRGKVRFQGTIRDGGLKLSSHSLINGNRVTRTYSFVPAGTDPAGTIAKSERRIAPGGASRPRPARPSARTAARPRTNPGRVFGEVKSIKPDSITIAAFGGPTRYTYLIDQSTRIVDAETGALTAEELAQRNFVKSDRVMVRAGQDRQVASLVQILAVAAFRLSGTLKRISADEVVVATNKPVPLTDRTRFLDAQRKPIARSEFKPGEAVTVTRKGRTGPAVEVRKGFMKLPRP